MAGVKNRLLHKSGCDVQTRDGRKFHSRLHGRDYLRLDACPKLQATTKVIKKS
jgi:hypothetical protein